MSDTPVLLVFEANSKARHVIQNGLEEAGLEGLYSIEQPENHRNSKAPALWLYKKGESPPSSISENDSFVKPVRLGALIDRVRKHINHKEERQDLKISMGPYDLDRIENVLIHRESGKTVKLTDKEKDILEYLYARLGKIVERAHLLERIWGYASNIETHTLETHIYRLRQKIEEDAANPQILITEEPGYRLIF